MKDERIDCMNKYWISKNNKVNECQSKNENFPYIAALKKQIEYLKEKKKNKKLYNSFTDK